MVIFSQQVLAFKYVSRRLHNARKARKLPARHRNICCLFPELRAQIFRTNHDRRRNNHGLTCLSDIEANDAWTGSFHVIGQLLYSRDIIPGM